MRVPGALAAALLLSGWVSSTAAREFDDSAQGCYCIGIEVADELRWPNTPLDPEIDFGALLRQAGVVGVLDPNSVEVFDATTAKRVPSSLDDQFSFGDRGRVQWVAHDPKARTFEIRFRAAAKRPAWKPRPCVPPIGTGDLLRFNAGEPRPITLHYGIGLHDLDGDGQLDLAGAWDYAHQPERPWGGLMVYPGMPPGLARAASSSPRADDRGWLEFGELTRLRLAAGATAKPDYFRQYPNYVSTAFADFNGDGRLDVACAHRGRVAFYLHSGRVEVSGMPVFESSLEFPISGSAWRACRAVDLNRDGKLDLVVEGRLIVNQSRTGWPFEPAAETPLGIGDEPCFLDLDGDEVLDAVTRDDNGQLVWLRNLGRDPLQFGEKNRLAGFEVEEVSTIASYRRVDDQGLLIQHDSAQEISVFRYQPMEVESPRFERIGRAGSVCAIMSLSDQARPCAVDWDDDGDLDLLVGGGYGWPRVVINEGTSAAPAYAEPQKILVAGEPIRLLRNELLGPPDSWHNMGYPMPDFVDWDGDGLRDLMMGNETNRIFWYRNIGKPGCPEFGERSQIVCDSYPDSEELRQLSATRAADPKSNNGVYPLEKERPFLWRTGPAFADFNGDGLVDLVTQDGSVRHATLFVQYRHQDGKLRLKRDQELKLQDGRPIDDRIVNRKAHWTESFCAVDWDRDGLLDLIYSCAGGPSGILDGGSMYLLKNVGSKTDPIFAAPQTMRLFGEPINITAHGPHPWVGDFDGDGWADLIAVVEWSVYPFYCHAALMLPQRPRVDVGALRKADAR